MILYEIFSVLPFYIIALLIKFQCVELLIRSLKDCLKSSRWEEARYLVRFVSDLVNCHVISAGSLLQLLDNFVDAALEEGVPQVCTNSMSYSTALI